ncbi:MAG: hypothetical protein J6B54_07475 [Clostridia bacterium]|nr:hypothetical protein [Clostridia bacterium]
MQEFGIDISAFKESFDFQTAVAEGVRFIIPRGAYSAPAVTVGGGRDTSFVDYYEKTVSAGLPVGTYQYAMARTEEEALAEARFFEDTVLQGRRFDLPVYYDMEDPVQKTVNREALTRVAKAWCDYLESRGYWVGIYASRSFFETYLNDEDLQRYAHWVAEWSTALTYKGKDGVCGLWQFGGSTNLIRSNVVAGQVVDQNYLLIDYPARIRAAGKNGFSSSPSVPVPPSGGFLPNRGYFRRGDLNGDVEKINRFWYDVFPAYAQSLDRRANNVLGPLFGENTEAWTKEFQRRTGLASDGKIGPVTLAEMKKFGFRE